MPLKSEHRRVVKKIKSFFVKNVLLICLPEIYEDSFQVTKLEKNSHM